MEQPLSGLIQFPRLIELTMKADVHRGEIPKSLYELICRIRRPTLVFDIQPTFGSATIAKLANLTEQLEFLENPCIFTLGFHCKEQLLSYAQSLSSTISLAPRTNKTIRCVFVCRRIQDVIEQIYTTVSVRYDGLS